jgi:hypothetical protein
MLAALTEKGVRRELLLGDRHPLEQAGRGDHAEMLRWLWRDYLRTDDPKDDSNRKLLGAAEGQGGTE